MKKNRILKLGLLALTLTLVTASLVSGTFAKYITTASGTGAVSVAKWHATVSDGTSTVGTGATGTVNFDLFKTINNATDVVNDHIAPGTDGSFSLTYATTGTEVDHQVKITLTKTAGTIPTNMEFVIGADSGLTADPVELDFNNTATATFTKTISANALDEAKTGTLTITWDWPYQTTDGDDEDNADGILAKDISFSASFEAVQLNDD